MDSSRMRKSIKNISFNIACQLLTMIVSFITRTVFVSVFCDKYLGMNAVFADLLSLLSLADLGIGLAMSYYFYKPLAEGDYLQLAALMHFFQRIYRRVAGVVAILGILLVPMLPIIVKFEINDFHLTMYYLFSLANIVLSYLYCAHLTLLAADQKNYIVTCIRMITSILCMIFQIVVMLYFESYIAYIAVGGVCSFLADIFSSRIANRKYPFIREKAELDCQMKKDICRNMGAAFLYKISSLLLNATDNILISVMVNISAVGICSNYLMIQSQILAFFSVLFTSLTASVGNLIIKEDPHKRYEVFQCVQTVSFLICIVLTPCYVTLVNEFISIWLGQMYIFSNLIVYAIGINLYLACVLQPLWTYREATSLYSQTKWVMVICAILNIFLSILFGLRIKIAGIMFASAVSRLITYVWYEPKLLFREYFEENVRNYFLQLMLNVVLVIGVTALLSIVSKMYPVNTWGMWSVKAILFGCICLSVAWFVYSRSKGMSLLRSRLKYRKY